MNVPPVLPIRNNLPFVASLLGVVIALLTIGGIAGNWVSNYSDSNYERRAALQTLAELRRTLDGLQERMNVLAKSDSDDRITAAEVRADINHIKQDIADIKVRVFSRPGP